MTFHFVITTEQYVWSLILAALFATLLPPKGFGVAKRAIGGALLFVCLLAYAANDNNLQIMKSEWIKERMR